jgi:hypothetical protein
MIKFSSFVTLLEAAEDGQGKVIGLSGAKNDKRLVRDAAPNYNVPADKSMFSLSSNMKKAYDKTSGKHVLLGMPAGTPIEIHGHRKNSAGQNVYIARHPITKKTVEVPTTHIAIQTAQSGIHNPEYAVMSLWNHYGKKAAGVAGMHKEIDKAAANPSHPLNLVNAAQEGFKHGIKHNDTAKSTYYQNLRDASHTIQALASHRDFSLLHEQGAKMSVIGASRGELTDAYAKHGVKVGSPAATPKSDGLVISGKTGKIKTLSLKQIAREQQGVGKNGKQLQPKKIGSQIMSSSPEEARSVYGVALDSMLHDRAISSKQYAAAHAKLDKIKFHALQTNHPTDSEYHAAEANKHLNDLHATLDKHGLREQVLHEGMTGQGKFIDKQHVATHLVEIGPGAQVYTLGNHHSMNEYIRHHDIARSSQKDSRFARIEGSKNDGAWMATRVSSFKKKKK